MFEQLGGEWSLRAIINKFVDTMLQDQMIGFFFSNVDIPRLKNREYEFAARFLGAPITYSGRELKQAHLRHKIMGGHFDRRRKILEETLAECNVPQNICKAWLSHVDSLRSEITLNVSGECIFTDEK